MAGFRAAVLETVAMSGDHVSELDTAIDKLAAAKTAVDEAGNKVVPENGTGEKNE